MARSVVLALWLGVCLAGGATMAAPSEAFKPRARAAYLYKLATFITWPEGAFGAKGAPLSICIQGEDPFGPVLDAAMAGRPIGGRIVALRRLPRLDGGAGCHVAYLGGSTAQSITGALEAVRGHPVLTVTEAVHGPVTGVVHLMEAGGRMGFSINAQLAQESGLLISSKLLALAVTVKR